MMFRRWLTVSTWRWGEWSRPGGNGSPDPGTPTEAEANFMMVSFCLIDDGDAICISMETKIAPNKKVFIKLKLVATRLTFLTSTLEYWYHVCQRGREGKRVRERQYVKEREWVRVKGSEEIKRGESYREAAGVRGRKIKRRWESGRESILAVGESE